MLLISLASAVAGALLARWLRLPGGMVVGGMLGSAATSVTLGGATVPTPLRTAIFVGVGMTIGMLVTREMLTTLRSAILPAVLSAVLLIAAGILVTLVLRLFDIAPAGDTLATSPGALSVLGAAALDHGAGAPIVVLFHILRIVLILLTLPLLVRLLPEPRAAGRPHAPLPREAVMDEIDSDRIQAGKPGPRSHSSPRSAPWLQLPITAVAATAGGLLAVQVGIPGALIFGTTLGAGIVTVAFAAPRYAPAPVQWGVQVGLGWMFGTLVTPETVVALRAALVPAVLASLLIIMSGLAVAYLLRVTGLGPPGDVLATSPGAFEALAAVAAEHEAGTLEVTLFHTVRILLVILSLPLLLGMLR